MNRIYMIVTAVVLAALVSSVQADGIETFESYSNSDTLWGTNGWQVAYTNGGARPEVTICSDRGSGPSMGADAVDINDRFGGARADTASGGADEFYVSMLFDFSRGGTLQEQGGLSIGAANYLSTGSGGNPDGGDHIWATFDKFGGAKISVRKADGSGGENSVNHTGVGITTANAWHEVKLSINTSDGTALLGWRDVDDTNGAPYGPYTDIGGLATAHTITSVGAVGWSVAGEVRGDNFQSVTVPEPAGLGLALLGSAGLMMTWRRRRKS